MKIEKLTKEAFAAFGDVVEMDGAEHFLINQHFAERFNNLANVDVSVAPNSPSIPLAWQVI